MKKALETSVRQFFRTCALFRGGVGWGSALVQEGRGGGGGGGGEKEKKKLDLFIEKYVTKISFKCEKRAR